MAYKVDEFLSPKIYPGELCKKSYICDSESDIQNLPRYKVEGSQVLNDGEDAYVNEPCHYGSTATVTKPFSGYVLSADNTWTKVF